MRKTVLLANRLIIKRSITLSKLLHFPIFGTLKKPPLLFKDNVPTYEYMAWRKIFYPNLQHHIIVLELSNFVCTVHSGQLLMQNTRRRP